jgi:hypothetical protein
VSVLYIQQSAWLLPAGAVVCLYFIFNRVLGFATPPRGHNASPRTQRLPADTTPPRTQRLPADTTPPRTQRPRGHNYLFQESSFEVLTEWQCAHNPCKFSKSQNMCGSPLCGTIWSTIVDIEVLPSLVQSTQKGKAYSTLSLISFHLAESYQA